MFPRKEMGSQYLHHLKDRKIVDLSRYKILHTKQENNFKNHNNFNALIILGRQRRTIIFNSSKIIQQKVVSSWYVSKNLFFVYKTSLLFHKARIRHNLMTFGFLGIVSWGIDCAMPDYPGNFCF